MEFPLYFFYSRKTEAQLTDNLTMQMSIKMTPEFQAERVMNVEWIFSKMSKDCPFSVNKVLEGKVKGQVHCANRGGQVATLLYRVFDKSALSRV